MARMMASPVKRATALGVVGRHLHQPQPTAPSPAASEQDGKRSFQMWQENDELLARHRAGRRRVHLREPEREVDAFRTNE